MKIQSCSPANSTTKENKQKEKGSIRAYAATYLTSVVTTPASSIIRNKMKKINTNLSSDQLEIMNKGIDYTFKKSGLADKGVVIKNLVEYSSIENNFIGCLFEKMNGILDIRKGNNAAYAPLSNEILINREKAATLAFHEMGHAFNKHYGKLGKILNNMYYPMAIVACGFGLLAAFGKKEEAKDGEELTKGQKIKNFLRNNSGILASISTLPILADEIIASVRGCKWANSTLPNELAKKIKTTNILGACTYVLTTIFTGVGIHLALKVKDSIMEKEKNKTTTNNMEIKKEQ